MFCSLIPVGQVHHREFHFSILIRIVKSVASLHSGFAITHPYGYRIAAMVYFHQSCRPLSRRQTLYDYSIIRKITSSLNSEFVLFYCCLFCMYNCVSYIWFGSYCKPNYP